MGCQKCLLFQIMLQTDWIIGSADYIFSSGYWVLNEQIPDYFGGQSLIDECLQVILVL